MKHKFFSFYTIGLSFLLFLYAPFIQAQTTAFTYQGKLNDSGAAANATYDMQFRLFNTAGAGTGTQQGATITNPTVQTVNGIFTVNLDFGSLVLAPGANLFLEISIRSAGSQGGYTALAPRQQITSAPYAVQSLNAANAVAANTATNSLQLGGVAANQFVVTTDARLSDARSPLPGDGNYIQNATNQQTSSNFNISGSGTANIFNATTQFNIGGNRVFSVPGTANTFVGNSAGTNNATGASNTFLGFNTGVTNTTGSNNTLIGNGANVGANNLNFATAIGSGAVVSANNTLVLGRAADTIQIPGGLSIAGAFSANSFNATTQYEIGGSRFIGIGGTNNTFVGINTGTVNTSGQWNSFFGKNAGAANNSGSFNAFFGFNAGAANTTANNNSFFGQGAGFKTTTGGDNTYIGNGSGLNSTTGAGNTFVGSLAGQANNGGSNNSFFGVNGGIANIGSNNNTFIGANSGNTNLTGGGNTYLGADSDGAILITNSAAIGQKAYVGQSNSLVLGSINGVNGATADMNVGIGTSTPTTKLYIKDNLGTSLTIDSSSTSGAGINLDNTRNNSGAAWRIYNDGGLHFYNTTRAPNGELMSMTAHSGASDGNGSVFVNGDFYVKGSINLGNLGTGGTTSVCWHPSGFLENCSSSLRYKKDVSSFTSGLSLLNQLNPITFRWKVDDKEDLGFGAEDVARVEPLLATYNKAGEVEGVKYDRISAVLVNAVKEQQAQIAEQQKQIAALTERLARIERQRKSIPTRKSRRNKNARQ